MTELGFDVAADLLRLARPSAGGYLHRGTSSLNSVVPLRSSSRGISSLEVSRREHPSTPDVWRYMREHGRPPEKTSNVEKALWATRLGYVQGLRDLPAVSAAALPEDVDAIARCVYEGFLLLVRCRWARVYGAPVVFDREFAAGWCSVSSWQAKEARYRLSKAGYMLAVGKRGLCIEWLPRVEP